MITFIIIVVVLFFIFRKKNPKVPQINYYDSATIQRNTYGVNRVSKIKVTVSGPELNTKPMDDSIIDVGSQSYRINSDYELGGTVPYWSHSYVYSYNELKYATASQQKFYFEFKAKFLNGEYLDLEGNTNYAFILLFDLLNMFDSHKTISKLESQLEVLGNHYPKTKSYGIDFLIKKMQSVGDTEGVARLREDHYDYSYTQVNYSTFEWRNKYKKILNLKKDETNLLDKIWYSSNTFVNIEYCCISVIRLYLSSIPKLQEAYNKKETTMDKVFDELADVVVRKHFRYRKGSTNYRYAMENCTNEFYTSIFKYCENAVRDYYGHKRKISIDPYGTTPSAKEEFETKITNEISIILAALTLEIKEPDESTHIKLNLLNTTRWKIKFDEIVAGYKNPKDFSDEIILLGNLNKENPSVENIFYEASKFIAKYDKEIALSLYIRYIHHDLNSVTFDNKQLTKTIQKSLFKKEEQIVNFETIVREFIEHKDLEKALQAIPEVYAVKRKKIQLDQSSIKEVQQQHSGTVELLNEYLKDETDDITKESSTNIIGDEIEIKLVHAVEEKAISIYSAEMPFKEIHTSTLEIFSKNNFSILQSEFEIFAKSKGAFKNQLIENINDLCYERLDDVLIEEDEDYYTINQNYYQKLLAS